MKHEEDEIYVRRNLVELRGEPFALGAGGFFQRAIKHEQERVGGSYGIVSAVLEVGEALEIVTECGIQIAVHIMISQRRIDGNFLVAPDAGFAVPDFPIVYVIAVVNDISGEANESGVGRCNGLDKSDADFRISGLLVAGVVETRVAVGYKAEGNVQFNF